MKELMRYEIKFHEQSEGWKHDYMPNGHCVCIERPQEIGGGYVTIDFKRRIFGIGAAVPRFAAIENLDFKGRDWQRRLIEAAVKHLNDVMK